MENRSNSRGGFGRDSGRSGGFSGGRSGGFNRDSGRSGGYGGGRDGGRSGGFNRDRRDRPEMHDVVCDKCGKDCQVPFKPSGDKPVLCSDCFRQSGDSRGASRDSGRGRSFGSRDSGRNQSSGMSQDQFKEINTKLDKLLEILENVEIEETDEDDEKAEEEEEEEEEAIEEEKESEEEEEEEETSSDEE